MAAGSGSARPEFGRAALAAGVLSGVPSTAWALVRGRDPLEASRAAGRMLVPGAHSDVAVLAAGAAAHAALTVAWTSILRRLPAGRFRAAGYGLGIAALDLGVAHVVRGRRFTAIAELSVLPQVADHLAFGLLAGLSRTSRPAASPPPAPASPR